jgi:integrase
MDQSRANVSQHLQSLRSAGIVARRRDLALFNLAIDSKLRGASLRLSDIAPRGHAVDRATIRQHKTGRPVRFELTEQTREAVDAYLKPVPIEAGAYLFPSRGHDGAHLSTRQYARLLLRHSAPPSEDL